MFKPRLMPRHTPNTFIFWVLLDPILYNSPLRNFGFLSITRTHFWSICLWEHFVWFNWKNWTLSQLFWPFAKGATGYISFASLMKWIRTFLSTCLSSHPCAPQLNTVIYLTLDLKPMMFSHIWGDPNSPWLQTQNSALCNWLPFLKPKNISFSCQHIIFFFTHDLQQKHLLPKLCLSKWYLSICWTRRWFKLALKKTSHFKDHPNEIHVHGVKPYQYSKKHVFELDNSLKNNNTFHPLQNHRHSQHAPLVIFDLPFFEDRFWP